MAYSIKSQTDPDDPDDPDDLEDSVLTKAEKVLLATTRYTRLLISVFQRTCRTILFQNFKI